MGDDEDEKAGEAEKAEYVLKRLEVRLDDNLMAHVNDRSDELWVLGVNTLGAMIGRSADSRDGRDMLLVLWILWVAGRRSWRERSSGTFKVNDYKMLSRSPHLGARC